MVLPPSEIPDVASAADVGSPRLVSIHDSIVNADREQDSTFLSALALHCRVHLPRNPGALYRSLRQNDHHLVEEPNRLLDAFLEAIADLQVLWGEPAPQVLRHQVSVQSLGKGLIVAGVADE